MVDRLLDFRERLTCDCCGARDLEVVLEKRFVDTAIYDFIEDYYVGRVTREQLRDEKYSVARCRECGFLCQKYVLNQEGMNFLYEEVVDATDSLNKREKAPYGYFRALIRSASVVQEFFRNVPARSIRLLDFGMGWGHWAIAAKACGFWVVGYELSSRRAAFARKHGIEVVEDLVNYSGLFDFVNTDQVCEHLADPYDVFRQLSNKLRSGGVLKIFVPNGNGMVRKITTAGWKASKGPLQPLEHVNCFDWNAMVRFAKRVGLRPARMADFHGPRAKLRAMTQLYYRRLPSWYFIKDQLGG